MSEDAQGRKYTCAMCGGVFIADWTEEEALAELKGIWGLDNADGCDQVCDDCWEKVRPDNPSNKGLFNEWEATIDRMVANVIQRANDE